MQITQIFAEEIRVPFYPCIQSYFQNRPDDRLRPISHNKKGFPTYWREAPIGEPSVHLRANVYRSGRRWNL